ncbi:MAG TPA: hypothetical protein VFU02_14310 [Polyangiaceae bacterium]|nr:hypothetical protein [Polyangiaceae bacterium]
MPARIKALWLLAWALLKTLVQRLFRPSAGLLAFRDNYDGDGLPPVTPEERAAMETFSRCIACGLCDQGEAERIARSGGAYRGLMPLMVAASRSMPDYRAAAYSFSFVPVEVLEAKEAICPTRVPMLAVARFVQAKANEVGGQLPLPARVTSLPPRAPLGGTAPEGSARPPAAHGAAASARPT